MNMAHGFQVNKIFFPTFHFFNALLIRCEFSCKVSFLPLCMHCYQIYERKTLRQQPMDKDMVNSYMRNIIGTRFNLTLILKKNYA